VLQRSGANGALDEGRLDLGQPSQIISRQLRLIHFAYLQRRCCSISAIRATHRMKPSHDSGSTLLDPLSISSTPSG
jgi:hypothetical protein